MPNSSSNIKKLTPDVYDIAEYVGEIQKNNMDGAPEDTLMLGIFGFMREVFSDMGQNSIVMASEFASEGIPTKAKFEKNLIAHALSLGITTLNAVPAQMEVFLTFQEDQIINAIGGGSGEFIYDCDNPIYFGDYEFHPDYDIIIKRVKLVNGNYTYTAMYDMEGSGIYTNPVSDITNPYLTPPVVMKINSTRYLFTACTIRQVEKKTIYGKVLSDNTISAKTFNFNFESQLAGFDVNVINSNGTTHLTPIYEGLSSSGTKYPYVWFNYMDTETIRLKFDRSSYYPRLSSDIEVRLQTTQGQAGNFVWSKEEQYPIFSFDSERLGYSSIIVEVRPINYESRYGMDKKTVEELREIIPKEALSRGSITNTTDLQNYFNAIDTNLSKMYFYKKKDNCMGRLYYSYIVMKDAKSNVIPSNTVPIMLDPSQLVTKEKSGKLILKRGTVFRLEDDGYAKIYDISQGTDDDHFYYIIPYNLVISESPMYGIYFLTTMNVNKNLGFTHINEECQYQYIATYINWNRKYTEETDTYKLTMICEQNLTDDDSMITVDPTTGEITNTNVKAYIVFYNDDDEPTRYAEGTIVNYEPDAKVITYEFKIQTNDLINENNGIRVTGVTEAGHAPGSGVLYGYLPGNCKAMIHIVTYQPEYSTDTGYTDIFGDDSVDLKDIIPLDTDWCVSNSYEVKAGVDFFYNYSEIVYSYIDAKAKSGGGSIDPFDPDPEVRSITAHFAYNDDMVLTFERVEGEDDPIYQSDLEGSTAIIDHTGTQLDYITPEPDPDPGTSDNPDDYSYYFVIDGVPLLKWDYFKDESTVEFFCNEIIRRKTYISNALPYLEDSFGMDFKFFNTYGPAHMYTTDGVANYLNRVNISLKFRLGLRINYDENIIQYIKDDVKEFIDNINSIDSIHMTNLTTEIEEKYAESVRFFEFLDFNGYGPGVQHIYTGEMPSDVITPELVSVHIKEDGEPDIDITIA